MSFMLKFLKKYYNWLAVCIISTLLVTLSDVFILNILKNIINESQNAGFKKLPFYLISAFFILIIGSLASYMKKYSTGKFGSYSARDIREKAVQHFSELPIKFVDTHSTGDIMGRLNSDVNAVQDFIENKFSLMIYFPIMVIVYFSYLIYLNFTLFIASFFILPIIVFILYKTSVNFKKRSIAYMSYLASTNNVVQEMVNQNIVVKAYGLEDILFQKYQNKLEKATDMAIKNDIFMHCQHLLYTIAYNMPYIICYCLGAYFCIKGKLTLGELIAFTALISKSLHPCIQLQNTLINFKLVLGSLERIYTIFNEEPEYLGSDDDEKSFNFENIYAVEFLNVSFTYDYKKDILNELTFSAKTGQTTAIVGASGSGKSTIINALCAFYKISNGKIEIFGKDINEISINELRNIISYVSQNNFLFPTTVCENIVIGNDNATRDDVIKAAKTAYAHDFIMQLPNGYDTKIGERGAKLSGGQMQRIAIARAFIKDAPIIVLDEATSALDTQSEFFVQKAIENIKKTKTLIIIAHRLSTIKDADNIIVINDGNVAEKGIHDTLMKSNGIYKSFYEGGTT